MSLLASPLANRGVAITISGWLLCRLRPARTSAVAGATGRRDKGRQCGPELLGVLVGEIELVLLAVQREGNGLVRYGAVNVVYQRDLRNTCHGALPFRRGGCGWMRAPANQVSTADHVDHQGCLRK